MPKKFGVNTKKEEAKQKKEIVKKEKVEKEIQQKEDEYWKETDDKVLKKLQKNKEKEEKELEKQKRKQEAKELLEKEEEELLQSVNNKKNTNTNTVSKEVVTKGSVIENKQKALEKLAKNFDQQQEQTSYASQNNDLDMEKDFVNDNFMKMEEYKEYLKSDISVIEGSGIDSVMETLNIDSSITHPEKRMRAAWNAYLEKYYPDLKKQYPKFRRQKLLDMLSKDFHKSTENPMVIFKMQKQKEILRQQLLEEDKYKKKSKNDVEDQEDDNNN